MKITKEFRQAVIEKAKSLKEEFKPLFGSRWWQAAMIAAWKYVKDQIAKVIKLLKQLRALEEVSFSYYNAKGEVRKAKGTLKRALIENRIKGTSTRRKNPLQIRYLDLERDAFRSFNILRLI